MEKGIEVTHTIVIKDKETGEEWKTETVSVYNVEWPCFNVAYLIDALSEDFAVIKDFVNES